MLVHEDDGMMLQFEVVDTTTSIDDKEVNQDNFVVFPNPITNGSFTVGTTIGITSYELYSLTGNRILHKSVSDHFGCPGDFGLQCG